jgi:hypothetical protein
MQKLEMEEHVRAALREAADFRDTSRPEGLTLRAVEISDMLMTDILQFAEEYRSEAAENAVPVHEEQEDVVIDAPGASAHPDYFFDHGEEVTDAAKEEHGAPEPPADAWTQSFTN